MATNITETVPTGAIRYNTDSNKMECFNGTKWMQVAVSSPDLDGGGRGVFANGYANASPHYNNVIQYITIATAGNAINFGDTIDKTSPRAGLANATRGIIAGGWTGSGESNTIETFVFASTGDTTDYGDLVDSRRNRDGAGSATRGLFLGGYPTVAEIEYITIASTGAAKDFGNLTQSRYNTGCASSPTRALAMGGDNPATNIIDYVTIASTGDAQDFGDLVASSQNNTASGNSIRAINASGGSDIEYVTISTLGNAVDFATNSNAGGNAANSSCSSPTRFVISGGGGSPGSMNDIISYIAIQTGGTAVDFGDLLEALQSHSGMSNCNGGL